MSLVLTEEQEMMRATARELARAQAPIGQLRALRDSRDADGFSRTLWREMAALGLPGMVFPERFGGAGLGYAELGPVLEELGRTLAATPFVSTVLLGGNALLLGGSSAQQAFHLPAICAGARVLALAFQEGSRYAPLATQTRAEAFGDGFRLTGEKSFVLDGHVADWLIVSARTSGAADAREGITLFLVKADQPGIGVQRLSIVDGRNASRVRIEALEVGPDAVIGAVGRGGTLLEEVLDRATVGLCAEMLGAMQETFDRTLAYLKERRQFGVPIGSFQALKHRAARLFCEIELARTAVMDALRAVDAERSDAARAVSVAKARCSDVFTLVTNEAVQMHGGIGVTDELDIGLFLKRARVAALSFGDGAWHRDRFARLEGF